jgi:hypothetical protein
MTITMTSMTNIDDGAVMPGALPAPTPAGGQTATPAAKAGRPAGLGEQR